MSLSAVSPAFNEFQFTHPGKGATADGDVEGGQPVAVSIHAPWEGCDEAVRHFALTYTAFQFTHPGKGATQKRSTSSMSQPKFQFTHPGKGATERTCHNGSTPPVSIHAPWEGCDSAVWLLVSSSRVFQFTHPGKGATPRSKKETISNNCFNSRTLGRVRLIRGDIELLPLRVSIHAPWEGCDWC